MSYNLFKGYVPTKNKECTMAFKGKSSEQLQTLKTVSKLDEYAGILNDDAVLIDIDDEEQSNILMRIVEDKELLCRVYKTTRGMHFLFRNNNSIEKNKTHTLLACGLSADIKLGTRTSYSILKYDNHEREIIYDIFEDEDYQDVPKYLLPITSKKIPFIDMKEGDGRNQELFNYILTLQSNDFSKEDAKETIEIINTYILKKSLEQSELDIILRDDSFKKPIFFSKNVFLFDKFAKFLISEHHIIKLSDQLHIYKDGVYVTGNSIIESEMIKYIPSLNKQKRSEVLSYLDILASTHKKVSPANYIAFKNGIYNLDDDTLKEFDPNIIITNKINHDYNPNVYNNDADNMLNKLACNDKKIRLLLEEVVGYTFYRRNELRKCFMLKGKKSNGKSTFLSMLQNVLGDENVSNLDLKNLGEQFKTAELYSKLCNIGDDIEDEYIKNTSVFKKVVSGDPIVVEKKGLQPFTLKTYAKLLFSANAIPRMGKGKDNEAILDRIVIIPFDAKFSKEDDDFDPYIKYKLLQDECAEYLIKIGIEGLKRVLSNQQFTINEKIKEELKEFEEDNNPMLMFFNEIGDSMLNEPTKRCYQKYVDFCIENNTKRCSQISFSRQVNDFYKYTTTTKRVNGKTVKVFVKKEGK